MPMIPLNLLQQVFSTALPTMDAMMRVCQMIDRWTGPGLECKVLQHRFPTTAADGYLLVELVRLRPDAASSLTYRFQVAWSFSTFDTGITGCPISTTVQIRQAAWIEQRVADEGQARAIVVLQQRYEAAFRHADFDCVDRCIGVVAAYASSYTVGRLQPAAVSSFDTAFATSQAEVAQYVDPSRMGERSGGSGRRVFATLIEDELEERGGMCNLRPLPNTVPEEWCEYAFDGRQLGHARGTYNFVVRNGRVRAADHQKVGHFHLSGGQPVEYAGSVSFGHMDVTNPTTGVTVRTHGVVTVWDNNSGHFRPHPAMAVQSPFPQERFMPFHVGLMGADRKKAREAQAAMAAASPLDTAIQAEYRSRGTEPRAQAAVDRILAGVTGTSKTQIKNRMLELRLINNLKELRWV